ncbi:MAG: hypothetical protein IJO29_08795 [Oscillospiraceae bacterium]|nr:hypothetical protein [Oscillospiraceae bacterium]
MKYNKLNPVTNAKASWFAWILIIAVQIFIITYAFAVLKTGYHYDETYSFALSNSYYAPFITGYDQDVKNDLSFYNVMVSGDWMRDYYTVGEEDAFSYGSVYHNQIMDVHPPLFYFLLHTISSLFPGVMSKWFGYPINIISFIICQFYLFKLSKAFTKSKFWGLWTCAFYGLTVSCIDCFVYVRMYSMVTAFATAFAYYTYCVFNCESPSLKKQLIPLGIITFLGNLTHHYFWVFAFIFTFSSCIAMLLRKRFKKMFKYGLSVLIGAMSALAVFPHTISHLLNSDKSLFGQSASLKFDFITSVKVMLMYTIEQICGVRIAATSTGYYSYIVAVLVLLLAVSLPLMFLFRDSQKLKNAIIKIKTVVKSIPINDFLVCALITVIGLLSFTSYFINILMIDVNAPRYIFMIIPLTFAIFAKTFVAVAAVAKKVRFSRIIIKTAGAAVAAICIVSCYQNAGALYLFEGVCYDRPFDEYIKGSDMILGISSTYRTQEIGWKLFDADSIYITQYDEFEIDEKSLEELNNSQELYVAVMVEAEEAMLHYCEMKDTEGAGAQKDGYTIDGFENLEVEIPHVADDFLEEIKEAFPDRTPELKTIICETNNFIELYSLK